MKVFICYGRDDASAAGRLYDALVRAGFEVWFDKESLVAGQRWEEVIVQAIRSADAVLAVLSSRSVGRRGFVNREIAEALKVLDEMPESRPFLIPVRLEGCEPSHRRLSELHRVDMFPDWDEGLRQVLKALKFVDSSAVREQPPMRAFVQIQLSGGHRTETLQAIRGIPGVVSVDETFGPFDAMIVLHTPNHDDLFGSVETIHRVAGVSSTSTHLIVPRR